MVAAGTSLICLWWGYSHGEEMWDNGQKFQMQATCDKANSIHKNYWSVPAEEAAELRKVACDFSALAFRK